MPVRIGFIGSGGIAGAHFNSLETIKDAQLVAFADMNTERAEAAARRFDGKAYADAREMLEAEDLDAVYVCLPPHVHGEAEIMAAKKGCALFIEKPVAHTVKVGEKIAAAIEDNNVIAAVGYHWRYSGATERAHSVVTAKKAPQPAMCYGRWLGGFPAVPWWRRLDQSAGQLTEQTTHIVDLARYLMGEITSVSAVAALREMDKVYEGTTVPDVSALVATFESGAIGHFSSACLLNGLADVGLDLYVRDNVYKITSNTFTTQNHAETNIYTSNNNPTHAEDSAFIRAVKTKKPAGIRSTFNDALQTLRVTLAANQSVKTGKVVKL